VYTYYDEEKRRWHIVGRDGLPNGERIDRYTRNKGEVAGFETEMRLHFGIDSVPISQALDEFSTFLAIRGVKKPSKPQTIKHVRERVSYMVNVTSAARLDSITVEVAKTTYEELIARKPVRGAKLETVKLSAATHHAYLSAARAFWDFCVRKGYAAENPWMEVERAGTKPKRKKILRIDEGVRFVDVAHKLADLGDHRAIGALTAIYMGLRATEIVIRVGRDVDARGTRLVIEDAKTENGNKSLPLPPELQGYYRELARVAGPTGYLFPPDAQSQCGRRTYRWLLDGVHRICQLAEVPIVSTHGLRGTFATTATEEGVAIDAVVKALRHGARKVAEEHYIAPHAIDHAVLQRVLDGIRTGTKPYKDRTTIAEPTPQDGEMN